MSHYITRIVAWWRSAPRILKIVQALQYLLMLASLITLPFAIVDLIGRPLDISYNGFIMFLTTFSPFKEIYAFTITVMTLNAIIWQLRETERANLTAIKLSNFDTWVKINSIDKTLEELKEQNKPLVSIYKTRLFEMYSEAFNTGFRINNKKELALFYNKYFSKDIEIIEENDKDNLSVYSAKKDIPFYVIAYSLTNFNILLSSIFPFELQYPEIEKDISLLFEKDLKKYKKDKIDEKRFDEEYAKRMLIQTATANWPIKR